MEKYVLCWKFPHRLRKYVGISRWSWKEWNKVIGKVCWKGMSEMRVVCGKKRECCDLAMEMAKMGAEIMRNCSQEASQGCAKVS